MLDRRGLVSIVVAILLSSIGGVAMSVWLSLTLYERNMKQLCNLMAVLDEGYNDPVQPGQPPLNERGRRIAAGIHQVNNSPPCNKI